jgi:creatinine amidohydrolase
MIDWWKSSELAFVPQTHTMQLAEHNLAGGSRRCTKTRPWSFPSPHWNNTGHHLPLFTDSMLLGRDRAPRIRGRGRSSAVRTPDVAGQLGSSPRFSWNAVRAAARVYLDTLNGLLENFVQHGFRRLVFINGHGGNDVPGKQANLRSPSTTPAAQRSAAPLRDVLELADSSRLHGLGTAPARNESRAGEWETSMILRLAPQLVRDFKSRRTHGTGDRVRTGHARLDHKRTDRGGPSRLSSTKHQPEKGEALLREFSDGLAVLLRRVIAWDGKGWNG